MKLGRERLLTIRPPYKLHRPDLDTGFRKLPLTFIGHPSMLVRKAPRSGKLASVLRFGPVFTGPFALHESGRALGSRPDSDASSTLGPEHRDARWTGGYRAKPCG